MELNILEILFQCANLFFLFLLLKIFVGKHLAGFLDNRAMSIKSNIQHAESSRNESERILNEQKDLLKKAHLDAQKIRNHAETSIKEEREVILAAAKIDAIAILDRQKEDLSQMVQKARADLKNDIAKLSLDLCEKILEKSVSEKDNESLIHSYLEKVKN